MTFEIIKEIIHNILPGDEVAIEAFIFQDGHQVLFQDGTPVCLYGGYPWQPATPPPVELDVPAAMQDGSEYLLQDGETLYFSGDDSP
jgi:hypothetical protein